MAEYWTRTIELLQPSEGPQLVVKPTLKPELLQKVPFKFLHDVITAVRRLAANLWCTRDLALQGVKLQYKHLSMSCVYNCMLAGAKSPS